MEKISFKDSEGNKVVGILSNPTGDVKKPVIILCHGFTGSKDSGTYTGMQDKLNKHGIATFRFDFFGHGESDGDFARLTISRAVDDILKAIGFLKEKGYSKIGLFGGSFGGISSIVAASRTDDLYVLVLKCPVCNDMHDLLCRKQGVSAEEWKAKGLLTYVSNDGRQNGVNYAFFEDSASIDGYKVAEKIDIPALIIHGDADTTVPVEQAIKTSKIIKDCRLEIFKGSGHHFEKDDHYEKLQVMAADFILSKS